MCVEPGDSISGSVTTEQIPRCSMGQLQNADFLMLMSLRKNGADAHVKGAASLFLACDSNPDPAWRLSIPDVMRVRGYSKNEAVNRTLQMQVR
jgi:hypothetical protein